MVLFHMSLEWFVGFSNDVIHHTCNLASTAWVIYALMGQLVASGGTCLGHATNNVFEYSDVIELLWDVILHGITFLEVIIDSQLVVS